jgi:hypothetical protein
MDTAIATFQAQNQAAITPKRGEVKPMDIFSLKRRKTDEDTVAELVAVLARDGNFLHRPRSAPKGPNTASSPAITGSKHGSAATARSGRSRSAFIRPTRPTR